MNQYTVRVYSVTKLTPCCESELFWPPGSRLPKIHEKITYLYGKEFYQRKC